MSNRAVIHTSRAPEAIGTYSQAVKVGNTVYLSGQIPLVPETMTLVEGDFEARATRVFENLQAVCEEAGGSLDEVVKVNLYLTDLANFATVNEVMARFFKPPYPARAAVQVAALPKGTDFEAEAVLVIGD